MTADQQIEDPLMTVLVRAKRVREESVRESQDEADKIFVDVVRQMIREHEITVTEAAVRAGVSRTNMHRLLAKFPEEP